MLALALSAVIAVYNLTGDLPHTARDFVAIPFYVPAGTAEINVKHASINDPAHVNILDFGLLQPDGTLRGWGGGNDEDITVGALASSRSYLLGPMATDANWSVVIGKAQLGALPGSYSLIVTLREAPTLPPQTERSPYKESAPLDLSQVCGRTSFRFLNYALKISVV
jgi:hypothetical protein